jgi:hypothetical protein
LICRDLIFRADPSASSEADINDDEEHLEGTHSPLSPDVEKSSSWDELWLEGADDEVSKG